MVPPRYHRKTLAGFLRFLASSVPWQHLYRQTFGKKHTLPLPAKWSLLARGSDSFDPLTFSPKEMTQVLESDHTTWADPFLWTREGRIYLYYEDWPAESPCGQLYVVELDRNGGRLNSPQRILCSNTHLSYPYVFEYDGQLWMLPENSASGFLQLYRCVGFPDQWVPDRILMEGVRYGDPTLFEHEGRWWLFMTLGIGFYGVNTNLFLFSAESPVSDHWTPHPMNPVVSGFHQSRPAGRIFKSNGSLFRPSQDCFKKYGAALRINEITRLTADHYEERWVRTISPWEDEIHGTHHLEISDDLILLDVQKLVNRSS